MVSPTSCFATTCWPSSVARRIPSRAPAIRAKLSLGERRHALAEPARRFNRHCPVGDRGCAAAARCGGRLRARRLCHRLQDLAAACRAGLGPGTAQRRPHVRARRVGRPGQAGGDGMVRQGRRAERPRRHDAGGAERGERRSRTTPPAVPSSATYPRPIYYPPAPSPVARPVFVPVFRFHRHRH